MKRRELLTQDQLQERLERGFERVIEGRKSKGWLEDPITEGLCEVLALLRDVDVYISDGNYVSLTVNAFKARKPLETLIGDLAVMVDIRTSASHSFQGVAFFEAKRREQAEPFRFQKDQPTRQLATNPYHSILYYEHAPAPIATGGLRDQPSDQQSRVLCCPSGMVLADPGVRPAMFTTAFSSHLADRLLMGYDADLSPSTAKGVFAYGARFYLHYDVGVARTIELARRMRDLVHHRELVPDHIVSMWDQNERLLALAREQGIEPPTAWPRVQRHIDRPGIERGGPEMTR